ncbi:MAG TPA: dTDP-4-dehydrorhamnose reductase [Patescibacteria group bacterium]|nr:dTDP-4-dehydrorhamnose reductase [Patescibacteria group bacterium]
MKVLVLGARGMLGQELVKVFYDKEVIAWDRDDLNIADRGEVFRKIEGVKPDVILNAAAYNAVDLAEEEKEAAFLINAEAVKNLSEMSKKIGSILVHYGTDYAFDGEKESGYTEDDLTDPQSSYGRSKVQGEKYLQEMGGKFYLMRLSRLFGKAGNGENAKKSFVDMILNLAKEKEALEIIDEELSSPTYAPDLAKLTKKIVANKMPYGIYHGANGGSCTWYEFAKEALKLKNISCKLIPVPASQFPRSAARPKYSILLNTKLSPARSWRKALKEYLKE